MASFRAVVERGFAPATFLTRLDEIITGYTTTIRQNCALVYAEITIPQSFLQPAKPVLNLNDQPAAVSRTAQVNHSGTLRVANAGCIIPIVKRIDGAVEWVDVGGWPLGVGLGGETGYQELALTLSKEDLVILTSEGVVKAKNRAGDMLGFDYLMQTISAGPVTSAETLLEHIKGEMFAFTGEAEMHDDMTVKHCAQIVPHSPCLRPTGQRFGHGIHKGHAAFCIGGNHRIADAPERGGQPALVLF